MKKEKPLVVIDGPNVALKHGRDERFSAEGIKLALEFFNKEGHPVLVVLPDYFLKGEGRDKKSVSETDQEYLRFLKKEDFLVSVPPQDYDDSYAIQLAKKKEGFLVSNDMFRDYSDKGRTSHERKTALSWVKSYCISYFSKQIYLCKGRILS